MTAREIRLVARMVVVLRETRHLDEAINVLAMACKTVVEDDLRRRVYPEMRRVR